MGDLVSQVADRVAEDLNADVILYNGPIERPADEILIEDCIKRRRRENALLILVTMGGDADAAYRIARCLQFKYKRFYLYVSGYCKSAGTLVAVGAHELIMSDHGELGPIDVQMSKKDELWESQSGLTIMDALAALEDNAFNAFETFFLETKKRSVGRITFRTSARIAAEMTAGLFAPLYGQIDPLHIGEAARAMSIAGRYGRRLLAYGQNIEQAKLDILSNYPSHGFVIDRWEATMLFRNVREPNQLEKDLADFLGDSALWPYRVDSDEQHLFRFLSTEPSVVEESDQPGGEDLVESGDSARTGPGGSAEEKTEQFAKSGSGRNAVTEPETDQEGAPHSST